MEYCFETTTAENGEIFMQEIKEQGAIGPDPLKQTDRGDLDDYIFSSQFEKTISER
jgi:hypothetical protein